MLSTIEIPDTYLGGANGLVQYKMEVRLHGKMTAYCDDMDLRLLDIKKSTKKELTASSKREISQWLRDAFASGQIEIEVVNDGFNLYGMTDDGNVYTRR
jgi:hypothetical protein